MIHPASDCLVRNCNSALGEQILDVTKAKGEPEIEPDRLVNDLRREPISRVTDFRHALRLPSRRRRDNASTTHDGPVRMGLRVLASRSTCSSQSCNYLHARPPLFTDLRELPPQLRSNRTRAAKCGLSNAPVGR